MLPDFPYRLAVFDMDDTLLGPDKKISEENRRCLDQLRANGVEVVIASGRYQANVAVFEERLGFRGWVISSGGAVVSHAGTGEIIQEMTIVPELALEIYNRGREAGITLIGYHKTGIYCDAPSEWTRQYHQRTGQTPVAHLRAMLETGMEKLIWMTAPDRITKLIPEVQAEYRDRLYVVNTERDMIDFLNPNVSKANAVEALARRLEISRDEIIAFGDGNNDVPLLKWAGMSVAMAHGREAARNVSKKVSPPGDPGTAVARSLEMYFGVTPA